MNLLVDTHILLWWLADDPALVEAERGAIGDPERVVYVSAASAWEISIKKRLGKLNAPRDLGSALVAGELEPLAITVEHAQTAGRLPLHHRDPFDRMLIAQAQIESLTIVTRDPAFAAYGVATLRREDQLPRRRRPPVQP